MLVGPEKPGPEKNTRARHTQDSQQADTHKSEYYKYFKLAKFLQVANYSIFISIQLFNRLKSAFEIEKIWLTVVKMVSPLTENRPSMIN